MLIPRLGDFNGPQSCKIVGFQPNAPSPVHALSIQPEMGIAWIPPRPCPKLPQPIQAGQREG